MWDFSVRGAFGLLRRTAPFLVFRIGVYVGIGAAYLLATGAGAALGRALGGLGGADFRDGATVWGGVAGFAVTAGLLYLLRGYILYLVKAGHVAVMVEVLEGQAPPPDQVAFARKAVSARFGEASVLFALDQLVKGVAQGITGLVQGVLSAFPVPGARNAASVLRAYLRVAVGLVDEVILAHALRVGADNPWAAGREALVLYAQNARPMLVNAAWLAAIVHGLTLVLFLVLLAPAVTLAGMLPGPWAAGGVAAALLLAWALKAALFEPFAIACLLQVFFGLTRHQEPNPNWTAKLETVSDRFRTMGRRAADWPAPTADAPDGPA